MRPRILQISTNDLNGGAERVAKLLFQAYRDRGLSSRLMVGYKYSDDPDIDVIPNSSARSLWYNIILGVPERFLTHFRKRSPVGTPRYHWFRRLADPASFMDWYRGYEEFSFPGIWQIIKTLDADIVHAHNLHGKYFDLNALPLLSKQAPLVLTLHDSWLLSGHCALSLGCDRWKVGCGQCPDLTIPPAIRRDATAENWLRKREIYSESRLYVTTESKWLMDKVDMSMLKGVRSRVISSSIPLDRFGPGSKIEARRELGVPVDSYTVLLIAHNSFKDYATMEAAISRVHAERELIFVCVGNAVARPSRSIGEGQVRYLPFVRDARQMALWYRAADVYIHAAAEDNFPATVLESLACGTPVVATAVGGISEQIRDGETGFLVPQGDAAAMAARVGELLTDSDLRFRMGQRAAEVARSRFALNRQVDEYLAWYEEVIADWREWKNTLGSS